MVRLGRGLRRERLGAVLAAVLALSHVPAIAFAQSADPKAALAAGDAAARAKNWNVALVSYQAAQQASPSADALEGVANAFYELKRDGEAYAAYEQYVKDYGAKVPRTKRAVADARMKELAERTGVVRIDSSEAGATVTIDDQPHGTTPLAAPIRLGIGPHRVRITKDGFLPFDQVPNVALGTPTAVQATLVAQSGKGRLSVKEKTGQPIRVLVDGVDVGDAPWSGEVDAGQHEITGRSSSLATAPEKVTAVGGKTVEVELVASSSTAPLRVVISDGKGKIYIDDKLVGEGSFSSEIPAGAHKIRVTRDGYDPFEEDLTLKEKEPVVRSVTLNLSSHIETGTIQKESRRVEGVYGGFGLMYMALPGGMGSSPQTLCDGAHPAELASCDSGGGVGANVNGYFGYHWDPVGVELFLAAQYDQSSPTLNWTTASTDPGLGPDPARTESFGIHRLGGAAALRVRLTLQSEKIRFTAAAGVGLAYTSMVLTRDTHAASDANIRDVYAPSAQSYLSPLLSFEPALHFRLSPTTSIGAGVAIMVESARAFSSTPPQTAEDNRKLGPSGLSTPAYNLATGTQFFVGPFVGMMFGP